MKAIILFLGIGFFWALSFEHCPEKPECLVTSEKDIYEYLDSTASALESHVEGLSEEQMQFSADENSWTIAQIVEHINIVEGGLKGLLNSKLEAGENSEMRDQIKFSDAELLAFITNRREKIKTQPQFEPADSFTSSAEALDAFNDQREKIVDWLKDSNADLRNYVAEFPFGMIDGYQTVLFMAGHTERHIKQIEEVKNNPNFPK
ncbi:DinB family protein [Christiangramia aquimixticola]|uniref:DinB family protein n=1 Tax=Christiangramia aquimixticola TaxID=1697558 RepID=UPI003AA87EFC